MILVGGENLIDFVQEADPAAVPLYRAVPGGSPYNIARAIARQGVSTGYLTPISTDALGQILQEQLIEDGVAIAHDRTAKPTALAVVSLNDGQAQYQFYREGTADRDVSLERLLASVPDDARAVHIGSLALTDGSDGAIWEALISKLKARGLFCSLDPNVRPEFVRDRAEYLARLERLYAQVDMIKLSDEDLRWLAGDQALFAAQDDLFQRSSAALVVLTLGSKGARAVCASGEVIVPAVPVNTLEDTVGAGDTFMGTLLAQSARQGLLDQLHDIQLDQADLLLRIAAQAAAMNCERAGCQPPLAEDLMPHLAGNN